MAYSKSSKGTFYVAFTKQLFYVSTNINAIKPAFSQVSKFPFISTEEIRQLETCDYDSNVLYVTTNYGRLLKTRDKGKTWTSLNKNLPKVLIIKFLLDQNNEDSSMYACTAFGIYYRNKFMNSWIQFSKGMPSIAQITDMELLSDGTDKSRLHISTYGRGIWQTDLYNRLLSKPVADFTIHPNSSEACANTIILINNASHSPTKSVWQVFPNIGWEYVNGTNELSTRAEIKLNKEGTYFFSLIVSNRIGTDTKTLNYNYSKVSVDPKCSSNTVNLGGFTIGIQRFELNDIDQLSNTGKVSYSDFSCNANTILRTGSNYTGWITNGNNYKENAKVYIDYNNNGDFTDANELVATLSSGLGKRSFSFTTLTNPPVLNTFIRMRVVSDFNTVSAPCGNLTYGETEDYAILFDKVKPFMVINIPQPQTSNSFTAILKSSEVVKGFSIGDLNITNGKLSNFNKVDPQTYSVLVQPINNDKVTLTVKVGSFTDFAGNPNSSTSQSTEYFLGIKDFTFNGLSTKDSIGQTAQGGNILCHVPFGTNLDTLKATFTLSDSSTAYIGTTEQISGSSKSNFTNTVQMDIRSKDSVGLKKYAINLKVNKNTACRLLKFEFKKTGSVGTIIQNSNGGLVNISVPFGTKIDSLAAYFNLSPLAKASVNSQEQTSEVNILNYTTKIIFKIRAEDTLFSKTYSINIFFGQNKECSLLDFKIKNPSVNGIITQSKLGGDVFLEVPFGTNKTNLSSIFTASPNAIVFVNGNPIESDKNILDYTDTVIYQVIAEDKTYSKHYKILVKTVPNHQAKLLTYSIQKPSVLGKIDTTSFGGYVTLSKSNTDLQTDLKSLFTISDSAKAYVDGNIQISGSSVNNFKDTVLYDIIAQDKIHRSKYYIIAKNNSLKIVEIKVNALNIRPNPTQDQIEISTVNNISGKIKINIVNTIGTTIKSLELGDLPVEINVSELASGLYYIYLTQGNTFHVGRFIKK